MDPEKVIEELTEQLKTATEAVKSLKEKLDAAPSEEEMAAIKAQLESQQAELTRIATERAAAERDLEVKRMRDQLDAQEAEIKRLSETRTPRKHEFNIGTEAEIPEPFGVTLWKAKKYLDPEAMAKLNEARKAYKALAEGTNSAGGFLVPPTYLQQLVALRRASAPLKPFVTTMQVNSNLVYVPKQTGVSTVGWVAENATKPATDEVFGQVAVNIFTLAGIAKVSNQLLEDSSPAVDQVIRTDLGKGLGIEEDRAMLNGTGTGQPTGILNTAGITSTPIADQAAATIYDAILAGIASVQANYYGQPSAVVMHPRTWSKMLTAKDSTNRYIGVGTIVGAQAFELPGVPVPTGAYAGQQATVFGVPVVIDANVPINLTVGANTNRSVIITAALQEAWWLERDGIGIDVSSEAGTSFETNQTWFRGEERAGFTAARYPAAFDVRTDVGP
jgi:HK97 family phage major capsid protein